MIVAAPGPNYSLGAAHGRIDITAAPEARCTGCGYPCTDHVPLRYALRPWLMHLLPADICRRLRRRTRARQWL